MPSSDPSTNTTPDPTAISEEFAALSPSLQSATFITVNTKFMRERRVVQIGGTREVAVADAQANRYPS